MQGEKASLGRRAHLLKEGPDRCSHGAEMWRVIYTDRCVRAGWFFACGLAQLSVKQEESPHVAARSVASEHTCSHRVSQRHAVSQTNGRPVRGLGVHDEAGLNSEAE